MAIRSHGDRLVDADPTMRKNLAVVSAAAGIGVYAAFIASIAEARQSMQVVKCYGCVIAGFLTALFLFKLLSLLPAFRWKAPAVTESFKRFLLTIAAFSIPVWATVYSLDIFLEYNILHFGGGGYIALMLGSAALGALIMLGVGRLPRKLDRALLIIAILLSYSLLFVHSFFPNIVNGRFNDVHHYSAVIQTIFNVAFNEPFTIESSATYGHYSLFMWPILKLFGHKPIVITLIFAACFFITETAFIALVFKLTKHDLLRAVAILGCGIMCLWPIEMSPLNRLGYFPLRLMCHMLMLVYILYGYDSRWYRNEPKRYYIVGYVLGALAIAWQIDFGISATLAFTVSVWIRQWQRERVFSRASLKVYGLSLLGCACSAAGTVILINIYNLLCGGPLILWECFFPLLGGESFVSGISRPLDFFGDCWMIPPAFFMVSVMLGLLSGRSFNVTRSDLTDLAICGTMGLAEYAYLFNVIYQAWVGVMCCISLCFVKIIEMALGVKDYKTSFFNAVRHGAGAGAAVFLGMFIVIFAVRGPEMVRERAELGIASTDSMKELSAQVENSVPKDTYAVGYYTQDVYAFLGWDPGYHKRDPANFFGEGAEKSLEQISKQDTVFAGKLSEHMFTEDMDFVITKTIPEEDEFFYYMEKYTPSATVLDVGDVALDVSGDMPQTRLPVTLRGNTMYEIEAVVSETTDLSASMLDVALLAGEAEYTEGAARSHTWDFMANEIPQGMYSEEEYARLVDEADRRRCFYIETGDIADGAAGEITVSVEGADGPVLLETLRVTELRRGSAE